MRPLPAGVVPRHGAVGGLGVGAQTQVGIPPLDAYQFTALAQQFGRSDFPGHQARVARRKGLQTPHVARECGAEVGARVGGIPQLTTAVNGGLGLTMMIPEDRA